VGTTTIAPCADGAVVPPGGLPTDGTPVILVIKKLIVIVVVGFALAAL
jgi:hypothetical protein